GRRAGRPLAVHLKVDTGMHRQGCDPAELPALVAAAMAEPGLEVDGLWSHFAVADEAPRTTTTDAQLARFRDALAAGGAAGLEPRWRHLANSAGATVRADARFDLVRTGIEVYGLAPSEELAGQVRARLRPALALRAAVSALRTVDAGERVSYGPRWEAPRGTRLAPQPGPPRRGGPAADRYRDHGPGDGGRGRGGRGDRPGGHPARRPGERRAGR